MKMHHSNIYSIILILLIVFVLRIGQKTNTAKITAKITAKLIKWILRIKWRVGKTKKWNQVQGEKSEHESRYK